jgi:hypothetical protein
MGGGDRLQSVHYPALFLNLAEADPINGAGVFYLIKHNRPEKLGEHALAEIVLHVRRSGLARSCNPWLCPSWSRAYALQTLALPQQRDSAE